jgi:hypothetical protein
MDWQPSLLTRKCKQKGSQQQPGIFKISNKSNSANRNVSSVTTHFAAHKRVGRIFSEAPSTVALFRFRASGGEAAGQHGVGGPLQDADALYVPPRHGQQQRYEPQSHQLCAACQNSKTRQSETRLLPREMEDKKKDCSFWE